MVLLAGALVTTTSFVAAGCGPKAPPEDADDADDKPKKKKKGPRGSDLRAVVLPTASPVVSFRITFEAGSASDPKGKEGLGYLLARNMVEGGTASLTYKELLDTLYPWAASISVSVDREQITFVARCHRDHLEEFYPILRDVLLRPRFDEKAFNRLRDEALNRLVKEIRTSNDEELSKAVLEWTLFEDHPYRHLPIGTEAGLKAITLADLKAHRSALLTSDRVVVGLAGAVDDALAKRVRSDLAKGLKPRGMPAPDTAPPAMGDGPRMIIVDKPSAKSTAISIGHPLMVNRADKDFAALALAASYLGEHRQSHGVLFKSIRKKRGMNYGDYAYVEGFIQEGWGRFPRTNIARKAGYFSIWIRPVPNEDRHFALRIAMWNLKNFVAEGIPDDGFEVTRTFLEGYTYLMEQTDMRRLGYRIDDVFYGLDAPHFERMRAAWKKLTAADVTAAVSRHLDARRVTIVVVTADAAAFKEAVVAETPSPKKYPSSKPDDVLAEDAEIAEMELEIPADRITIVPVGELFAN